MTPPNPTPPPETPPPAGPPNGRCDLLGNDLLARYAQSALPAAAAWSVEAHLPGCPACLAGLQQWLDTDRLERNRSLLMTRLGLPDRGPAGRVMRRCRVPDDVVTLLSATPSLRRSWLAGIGLVLLAAVGSARLITFALPAAGQAAAGGSWGRLMPFLVLAPLLPLASVAAAFSFRLDPSHDLAVAAPVSAVWLLCVRTATVIGATLVPTALAALALPGPWWLPSVVLLPALAVCAAALAAATVVGPVAGAAGAGTAWVAAVAALAVVTHEPALAFGPPGQLAAVAVLIGAVVALVARRERIDFGWVRGASQRGASQWGASQ